MSILGKSCSFTGVVILFKPKLSHIIFKCVLTRSKFVFSGVGSRARLRKLIKHLKNICVQMIVFVFADGNNP